MEDGVTILFWAVEDIGTTVNMHQVYESFIVVVSHNQMKGSLSILCATVKRCCSVAIHRCQVQRCVTIIIEFQSMFYPSF